MDFLPKDYEAPKTEGNYYKFKKGDNTFRILSPAIVGFEYWTKESKPIRATEAWEETPADAKLTKVELPDGRTIERFQQKHFWAFIVWNHDSKKVQIMEITQKTIQDAIEAYVENKKWGDPTKYDIVVKAEGDGLERTYTTIAEPHTPAPETDTGHINLEALYFSEDPFTSTKTLDQPF